MNDDQRTLDNFSGVARLFPLPNLVMFPSVIQPLHIFEPRYRAMLKDALADDRLMALVLLKPDWEENYHERPAIHSIGCLGGIFNEELIPDGRWNLLLHGLRRVRIDEELPGEAPYRTARVTLLDDIPPSAIVEPPLREEMQAILPAYLDSHGGAVEEARKLLHGDLSLSTLCDIFGYALPLNQAIKQQLLEELNVTRRTELLLKEVRSFQTGEREAKRRFPPGFSVN